MRTGSPRTPWEEEEKCSGVCGPDRATALPHSARSPRAACVLAHRALAWCPQRTKGGRGESAAGMLSLSSARPVGWQTGGKSCTRFGRQPWGGREGGSSASPWGCSVSPSSAGDLAGGEGRPCPCAGTWARACPRRQAWESCTWALGFANGAGGIPSALPLGAGLALGNCGVLLLPAPCFSLGAGEVEDCIFAVANAVLFFLLV